ncbi:MAG: Uma2 family endonuclease [Chloroflexi bacterium]|nr:Uma2 family endonuclease [Chloroflexota bacterium]
MVLERQLQQISADRFIALVDSPEYANRIVELVEGEIIEMPLPNAEHGEILAILTIKIGQHVLEGDLGRVATGDTGFILERNPSGRDTVRGMDLAFINKSKAPAPLPNTFLEYAPDFAVEVISPSNDAADIRLKIRQLLDAGTALVWIVHPETRTVEVHTRSGATTLEEGDALSGGDVLPGFEITVREIFPVPETG